MLSTAYASLYRSFHADFPGVLPSFVAYMYLLLNSQHSHVIASVYASQMRRRHVPKPRVSNSIAIYFLLV